jgi:hypothetical protein
MVRVVKSIWTFYVNGETTVGEVKVHNAVVYVVTLNETQMSHLMKLDDYSTEEVADERFELRAGGIVYN